MSLDLPLIWAAILAVAVLLYVLLDGFDLGIGVLFPFATPEERDVMTAAIAPVWDANETWLVLGGGGLFAAFPLAYAVIMPACYAPIMLMLGALIFRGVAFEFRAHGRNRGKRWWTFAFSAGSLIAVLAQGFVLGAFVQGIRVKNQAFAGGPLDWLTPFTCLTAVSLTLGYALLGSAWMVAKSEGGLQIKARGWAVRLSLAVAVCMALVSLATLVVNPAVGARWGVGTTGINWPRLVSLSPAPLVGGCALLGAFLTARSGRSDSLPYLLAALAFIAGYAGLAISIAPFVVPYQLTLWQCAAKDNALALMLVGVAIMLPVILGYTAFVYWIFRGKAKPDHAYG